MFLSASNFSKFQIDTLYRVEVNCCEKNVYVVKVGVWSL